MIAARNHMKVIHALIIRDLVTRFGRNNLGFVWTIVEPMLLCIGVMMVWSILKEPAVHGVPIVMFVLTGYMPLTLWRHLTNPATKIFRNNSALLYHRPIKHLDILVARLVLEFLSSSTALVVIFCFIVSAGFISALGVSETFAQPGVALAAWLLTAWYYGGIGMLIAAVTEWWEPAEKFIPPMQYLALPISGVFFMVDWMPDKAQRLLLLNPSVHCFEMFRAGVFGEGITTHYDPWYLIAWSAAMTLAGSAAVYHVRDRIRIR